ncbi:hypothetical protein EJB05_26380, partial [Eragrostis curvula]
MPPSSSLIVPPLLGAFLGGRQAITSSSARARLATAGHLFRLRGYSLVDRMVVADQSVWSGGFVAGGQEWRLCYYPKGEDINKPGIVSAFLSRVRGGVEISASYRISILDRDGNPAYSSTVGPSLYKYFTTKGSGSADLVSTEELKVAAERLVDDEDCLNIRCDVNVLSFDKEADELRTDDGCTEGTTKNYSESEYTIQ